MAQRPVFVPFKRRPFADACPVEFPWSSGTSVTQKQKNVAAQMLDYDGFTDIEFNPNRGVSCQAQAAAVYVSLARQGLLAQCRSGEDFLALMSGK